ncbi:MAG TPA: DUF6350 family protein [Nocardioidaceae bacterium]|nr:DUF6350 family protein [Nocardioidaceae bacterium]
MVDLLSRTVSRPGAPDRAPAPVWLAGLVAGAAMAVAGLVAAMGLAVVGWLGGNGGAMTSALRIGVDGWLLGHGSRLQTADATIELVPLGITMIVGWLALRGGRWAARASELTRTVDAVTVGATFACAYTSLVLVVALTASHPGAEPTLIGPLLVAAAVTFAAAGFGAVRQADDLDRVVERIPDELRAAWIGAVGGTLTLIGCAALTLVASLIVHAGALRDLVEALDPGLVGGLVLVVVCVAVLPNVILLTVSVLLGPGAAIGTGTSVTLSEVTVGPMPAVPWLAAVPGSGTQPAALSALAALPLICGVVAGAMAVRRYPVFGYDRAALRGLLAGVTGGLLVAGLVSLSGGAIGPGRMADVGPAALACLAVAVVALGLGGLVGGLGVRALQSRRVP